jgi:2,3,4,5-tetrahydropyridine-2-carboxylate N-succinyltransferase
MNDLQIKIETLFNQSDYDIDEARSITNELVEKLNNGSLRAAEQLPDGSWQANTWVKKGILLLFRIGELKEYQSGLFNFFDKDTLPLHPLSLEDKVRLVPGGSSIRNGAYVAQSVVCMPPMYINIGAYVDENTMIDSHALVGSCAQVGKRVHISAASQIGGVLEPPGALPVIIEDDVLIGGNCGVYEGIIIKKRAVLGSGVILTSSTPVYDLVNETIIRKESDKPLEIPENAVVVAGSRPVKTEFGKANGISIYTPVIIKYRDEKTDARTALEYDLR